MKANLLTAKYLKNEDAARAFIERLRWPSGPVCPHCGATKIYRLAVASTQRKVLKCAKCRRQFSVTVGTIFEDSHIPLTSWLGAMQLMCSSKKGMSAHQLHRMLAITYKSAWFMAHRIRHAMSEGIFTDKLGGIVEADETYIGGKSTLETRYQKKTPVMALVERGGRVRSFPMTHVTAENVKPILREHIAKEATLMTDEGGWYYEVGKEFADYQTVTHSAKEYVRGLASTNTAEGFFSLLKRGLAGTYHHVSKQHLHRYLAEFDFRYSARKIDDAMRTILAVKGTEGKRLRYQGANA